MLCNVQLVIFLQFCRYNFFIANLWPIRPIYLNESSLFDRFRSFIGLNK